MKVFFFYVWPLAAGIGTTWLVLILWHGKQEYREQRRRNRRFNSARGRRLVHLLHLSGGVR